ncbi:MAG: hypothetical protein LIO72_04965 [Ruminococcus sp.]|nr:hypothetical protein [Ruminococcus sp.]
MLKTPSKLFSIFLAIALLLALVGCQGVEDPDDTDDEVVGGGLVQARGAEGEDEAVETEDPVVDTVDEETIAELDITDMPEYAPEEGAAFDALVISVNGNSLAVCGLNTTSTSGLFTVSLSDDAEILKAATELAISDLTAGDIVYIVYNGEVMESYPAQISGATKVYYNTHATRLAEIEYLLPDGYEDFGTYFPAWDDFEY